jgi:trans-2-enoyl-CoA reductase
MGTWTSAVTVPDGERAVQKIDARVPLAAAATLLVNPPTAWRMLVDFVKLRADSLVIQNGATSAVGRCVIQMAKKLVCGASKTTTL